MNLSPLFEDRHHRAVPSTTHYVINGQQKHGGPILDVFVLSFDPEHWQETLIFVRPDLSIRIGQMVGDGPATHGSITMRRRRRVAADPEG